MAEKKRKSKEGSGGGGRLQNRRKNSKPNTVKKRTGPRLPSNFRKELDLVNHNTLDGGSEEEIHSDEGELGNNLYEYEEGVPEEESKKNRRFDPVENFEYDLPADFKVYFFDYLVLLVDSEDYVLLFVSIVFRKWGIGFGCERGSKNL